MRFPRNARVFRGQIEAAPFLSVFLLIVILQLLASSLVFTPGMKVMPREWTHRASAVTNAEVVRVSAEGVITWTGKTYSEPAFREEWQRLSASQRLPKRLTLLADPNAPRTLTVKLRDLATESRVPVETPSAPIELPIGPRLPGSTNPMVAVAVNLTGQYFFDNIRRTADELRVELRGAVKKAGGPLTLMIFADRAVEHDAVVTLITLAHEEGISEVVQATRPPLFKGPEGPEGGR